MQQSRAVWVVNGAATALMAALLGAAAPGCAKAPSVSAQPEGQGTLDMRLDIGGGVTLSSVGYTITGPAAFTRSGSIDVSSSNTVSALIGGIPASDGYTITLGATASDGTTCVGSQAFSVLPNATARVVVHLQCKQAPKSGSVLVNGTLNVCPLIDGISANPAEVNVGGVIALEATTHDADSGPDAISFAWTATSGTFADATRANVELTCQEPGTTTLTLTVSDGDTGCTEVMTVPVQCTNPQTTLLRGSWVGYARQGNSQLLMRFDLTDADGALSGTAWLRFPEGDEWVPAGTLEGQRNGKSATWKTTGDTSVTVSLHDGALSGNVEFHGATGEPNITASIELAVGGAP